MEWRLLTKVPPKKLPLTDQLAIASVQLPAYSSGSASASRTSLAAADDFFGRASVLAMPDRTSGIGRPIGATPRPTLNSEFWLGRISDRQREVAVDEAAQGTMRSANRLLDADVHGERRAKQGSETTQEMVA